MFLDTYIHAEPLWLQQYYRHYESFMEAQIHFNEFCSRLHTQRHCARVLLYVLKEAASRHLAEGDIRILATAAVFHDSRRRDDGLDVGHGQRAARYYESYCQQGHLAFNPAVYDIMAWHDRDDEEGIAAMVRHHREGVIPLYQLFKDADALDRFRISPTALDVRFLRTEEARNLVPYARRIVAETQAL